jgi:hypothetical protein
MTVDRSALTSLVCFGILASGGIAFAQDATDPGEAGGPPEGATPPAEGTTPPPDGATPPTDGAHKPDGAAAEHASRWPHSVIARPLTLPVGLAQVGADLKATHDFHEIALGLAAGYGITDDFEVNGFYDFELKEFEALGFLDVDFGYKLLRGAADGKLEVIARARAGYHFHDEALNPLRLGAHVQYNVTDKIALITPGQQLVLSLAETGGDVPGEAAVRPMFVQLPVALGFQPTHALYLQLDTVLGRVKIADTETAFFGADETPLALTAFYAVLPEFDVTAGISVDLTPPAGVPGMEIGVGDTVKFLLAFRYFIGQL